MGDVTSTATLLHGFDIFGLIVVGLCALRVAFVGFVREVSALAWLVIGAIAGFLLSGTVGSILAKWLGNGAFNQILGFIIVFLVVFLIVKLLERSLATILEGFSLQSIDRLLGFLLGIVEGFLVVFVIYFLFSYIFFAVSNCPVLQLSMNL